MKKFFALFVAVMVLAVMLAVPASAADDGGVYASITIDEGADNNRVAVDGSFTATITLMNPNKRTICSYGVLISADGFDFEIVESASSVGGLTVMNAGDTLSAFGGFSDTSILDTDAYLAKVRFTPKGLGAKSVTVTLTDLGLGHDSVEISPVSRSVNVTVYHTNHTWNTFGVEGATPDSQGYVTTKEATCQDGEAKRQCTVEGCELNTVDTKTLPGDPSKHVLGENYEKDATGHWKVCSVCKQAVGKVGHDIQVQINESDNTHSDHCKVCGWDGDHKAHASDKWVQGEDTHYKNCDTCGAKFDEAPHAAAAGAAWEKDSKEHYHYCETCKAKIDVAEHTPGSDLVEIKPATCTEPGLGNFTCKDCGQELSSAPIPATGHKKPDDPSQIQEVEPTCEEDGYIKYQCQNADHEVVEPSGKTALGHDMPEEWTVIKDATYLEKGEESRKCSRYDQCKHEEKQDIDVLPLDSDHLTVKPIVRGLDESVGAGVKAQIENFVKDYAKTGKHGPEVSDKFADAVMAALEGSEPIEIEVTVALDDVAANKLPASFNDAPGALLDSKQLTITAKVNGTAVDGDILSALPAPAAFSINKKYPNLIGLMNYGDEKGYSGLEFTKDGDVTTASALEVGYYALYTTSDLRWAEIFFDETNVFNGSAVEPKVRIVVNGKELDSSYYTISYKNNTKVGTGEFSIELTAEGKAAGFTLEKPIVNDFEITAAPAKPTTKPAEKDKSQSDVPATGDETNVVLYAAVMVLCTAALALVLLRKKSSR